LALLNAEGGSSTLQRHLKKGRKKKNQTNTEEMEQRGEGNGEWGGKRTSFRKGSGSFQKGKEKRTGNGEGKQQKPSNGGEKRQAPARKGYRLS